MSEDIRWLQRFNHFKKAYSQRDLNNLEKQGAIQAFEFTYELAWNVLRDYLIWQGAETISGSRDAIREAFKRELISDGHTWLAMLQDRNRTVHTYNEETANQILNSLENNYAKLFSEFFNIFTKKETEVTETFE